MRDMKLKSYIKCSYGNHVESMVRISSTYTNRNVVMKSTLWWPFRLQLN